MEPPRSLRVAAWLVAVQAAALAVWGFVEVIRSLAGHPHDRGTAVLLGVVVLIYAVGVAFAARGLWRVKRWAQTPTYLVQFFSIVLGIGQIHTLPYLMIPLIIVAVAALVAASTPASRAALGGI
jgi:predicted Kef-type K+ transport protein